MLPRGTGCTSYEQACARLQAREQEKAQRETQAAIDRAPVSGFGRSYAMGAPPMVRRPGRMIRGGPPPKYPGGWGAPEGEMSVGPDPVGSYLRMNAAMTEVAASYTRDAAVYRSQPQTSLALETDRVYQQAPGYADLLDNPINETGEAGVQPVVWPEFDTDTGERLFPRQRQIPSMGGGGDGAPALLGDSYNPSSVARRVKPPYVANPAHNPATLGLRKTPEPADAATVYNQSAIRSDNTETFYEIGQGGQIYGYFLDNAGEYISVG